MAFSTLSHLECPKCGAHLDAAVVQGTCSCGSPLLARYDLDAARGMAPAGREATLWRYHEVLPVASPSAVISLGEGMTPLLPLPVHGKRLGVPDLWMKDEGLIPTGSFKARGAAVGVSRAAELGVRGIAMPTNGNAGAAWALYAARAGMRSLIAMPVDAPEITRAECVAAGAELYLVDGLISHAGALIREALKQRPDYQDVSTLKEPYRIEGKKTMGYEIVEQLGMRAPDVILYPTGGGVGLIGIHKALDEMRAMGWLNPETRLVAVQAEGCRPIVDAWESGATESAAPEAPTTIAFGINVPKPLGDFLILRALAETSGTAVAVTDEELLTAQRQLARDEGTFICPEGAACFAALTRLRETGWLNGTERVVVLNTGTGVKYPDTVSVEVPTVPADGALPGPS
ncbi:threonine synthase [Actinokineospora baliensis]|uniref:threonine synthase n=1 Tax=Actinokineospora baliensis TaxID=547056 RepID=UPI001956A555|nr:threonine synthase [Actinokineospora baliensis]MBM7773421.1 threonine synthase [Actinokineospora baliensis]